jgi:lipopolysaccharide/colanic/teichoic acid biosynthesis glycosyltransferase
MFRFYHTHGKRLLDIAIAGLCILILSPLFILTAIAVALTSRGSIILVQQRVGLDGKLFGMLKFRTMHVLPAQHTIAARASNLASQGILLKVEHDPRVTPVGRIIRRFSLDELPQLFNVLMGDMSLVGPRPLLPFMVQPYPAQNAERSKVRPGLTGLWQISARGQSSSLLQMIDYDLRYSANVSLTNDLRIILSTLPVVLRGVGVK